MTPGGADRSGSYAECTHVRNIWKICVHLALIAMVVFILPVYSTLLHVPELPVSALPNAVKASPGDTLLETMKWPRHFSELLRRPRLILQVNTSRKIEMDVEPVPGEENIFFVETSCAVKQNPDPAYYDSKSGLRLSPRAACALESAAAAHPTHRVYLVHTCSVRRRELARGDAPAYALAALAAPNVRLWAVRFQRLFAGTPLKFAMAKRWLQRSSWPVVHASDIARVLLIWKYGGTYLDHDVLMLRSLGKERNFGCADISLKLGNGAFNLALDRSGWRVARAYIVELLRFRPDLWIYNGPEAIARAFEKVCKVKKASEMTEKKCGGFHLLPTSTFFAIPWPKWKLFFTEKGAKETMKEIGNNLAVHVWNSLSSKTSVNTSSNQPYAQIARKVCPNVVAAVGDTM